MKNLRLLLPFFLLAASAFAAEVAKVTPVEAAKLVAAGSAVLVDVREPAEWADTGVAEPAQLLSKSDFDGGQALWKPFLEKTGGQDGKTIILYCRSGNRSGKVAAALAEKGYKVANSGGMKDWIAAGLPVRKVSAPAENK